jgi:uncharacterized protein YhbP (UPF0306 family)
MQSALFMDNKATVKHVIENSTYLTLATTDGEKPWANAVFFASDKDFNLYFTSYNNSRHVKNILKNSHVSVAIFDSHIIPGTGAQGVQIEATCRRVTGKVLSEAIEVVYTKRFPDPKERAKRDLRIDHFSLPDSAGRTDHIYKITPKHFYILDRKVGKDTRIEVKM